MRVQRTLDFLSDSYRAVILLHEAHSLTATEIAHLLGESVGTVKIRLHRARWKLQEIMAIGCAISQCNNGVPCCEPKFPQEAENRCANCRRCSTYSASPSEPRDHYLIISGE